jgi:hypothetical protein
LPLVLSVAEGSGRTEFSPDEIPTPFWSTDIIVGKQVNHSALAIGGGFVGVILTVAVTPMQGYVFWRAASGPIKL